MASQAHPTAAVIVAAGVGSRFGGDRPKQFAQLGGRPVTWWAAATLVRHPAVARLVVVLPEGCSLPWRGWPEVHAVVAGGQTRSRSVAAGIAVVEEEFVLVHDGVRPWVPRQVLDAVVEATWAHGAAAPVAPLVDALKRLDPEGWIEADLPRERLARAQTPQGARTEWLRDALEAVHRAGGEAPEDEAAALARRGYRVRAVPGSPANVKVTHPEDLEWLERGLAGGEVRIGIGVDFHPFDRERPLVLGGVEVEPRGGLRGHSDADVALHAVLDAVLGAAGLGDLGEHFPPADPKWAGVASTELARRVCERVRQAGFEIAQVDLTLVAQRPRLGPWRGAMRERIAAALGLPAGDVSVKATSPEGLGALGRAEGMACHAVALLRRLEPS